MPFNSPTTTSIEMDCPITHQLFVKIREGLDWLKSAVSDGAGASQDLNTASFTANGDAYVTGDVQLGRNLFGNPITVATPGGGLAIEFHEKAWIEGFGVNVGGDQFAPQYGKIVWGEFVAWTMAVGMLRERPMRMPHREEC